jgi:hypothetical protein
VLDATWVAALLVPYGFWLRRRWESLLGALVLAGGVLLPYTLGALGTSLPEMGAALLGVAVGSMCSGMAVIARRDAAAPSAQHLRGERKSVREDLQGEP